MGCTTARSASHSGRAWRAVKKLAVGRGSASKYSVRHFSAFSHCSFCVASFRLRARVAKRSRGKSPDSSVALTTLRFCVMRSRTTAGEAGLSQFPIAK